MLRGGGWGLAVVVVAVGGLCGWGDGGGWKVGAEVVVVVVAGFGVGGWKRRENLMREGIWVILHQNKHF